MKRKFASILKNCFLSSLIWSAYNFFFVLLTDHFQIKQRENDFLGMEIKGINLFAIIVTIIGFFLWSIALYFFAKSFLSNTGNLILDFFSIFPIHIIILLLIHFAINNSSGFDSVIGWPIELIFFGIGWQSRYDFYVSKISRNFMLNACLTLIPYIFIYMGIHQKSKYQKNYKKHKGKT